MYDDDVRIVFGKLCDQFRAPSVQMRLRKFQTCGMDATVRSSQWVVARTMQGTHWPHPKKRHVLLNPWLPARQVGKFVGHFRGPSAFFFRLGANLRVFAGKQAEFRTGSS